MEAHQEAAIAAPQPTRADPTIWRTDRAKCGAKRHLLTDGHGIPRPTVLSGANRHDMMNLAALAVNSRLEVVLRHFW
jgi:hypothetical protein